MGIMLSKEDDKNVELSRRIAADLREKTDTTAKQESRKKDPDFAEDSEYVKDFSKTGRFAWVWILLGIIAVGILIGVGISKH